MTLHLDKLESPLPKDALCHVWLKFTQWFWRNIFLNFVNVFSLFRNDLPLQKRRDFSNRTNQVRFVPSLFEIGQALLEKKVYKFRQCIFSYFVIISPGERAWPSI